jgi:acyl-CoA thioesterase
MNHPKNMNVQDMWAADAASRALGMDLLEATDGRAVVRMAVRDDMVNGHGTVHGGLVASLADSAFAVACNSHGVVTVASGFDVTFLRPARAGDVLTATAVERVRRGRSGVCDVTVTSTDGEVVAEFRGRSRALPSS